MSVAVTIKGDTFAVSPQTRAEALATHPRARRWTISGIIGAALTLLAVDVIAVLIRPGWGVENVVAAVIGGLCLGFAVGVHCRVRLLRSTPAAWTKTPVSILYPEGGPSPWRDVIRAPRYWWRAIAVVAAPALLPAFDVQVPLVWALPFYALVGTTHVAFLWGLLSVAAYAVLSVVSPPPVAARCSWGDCASRGTGNPAVCLVDVTSPCGHLVEAGAHTCTRHLASLVDTGGTATTPTECPTCGATAPLKVTATRDLPTAGDGHS